MEDLKENLINSTLRIKLFLSNSISQLITCHVANVCTYIHLLTGQPASQPATQRLGGVEAEPT